MNYLYILLSLFICLQAQAISGVPPKFLDSSLQIRAVQKHYFSDDQIVSKDFISAKKTEWKACHQNQEHQLMAYGGDPVQYFLQNENVIKSLAKMEYNKLTSAVVSIQPWSGDYWPYASGLVANRFLDSDFNQLEDWLERYVYIQKNPVSLILKNSQAGEVTKLSPAEKYDLLIGDDSLTFTASLWAQGKRYYDDTGTVEGWMGICHGWAPAAIMEPRPEKSVETLSLDQKWKIHLNPSEIKGLASYSWATNDYPTVTLGRRCEDKNPRLDENGRIQNPECFDLNPGSWHISIVNMIGVSDRSFIMDATYDYEVWNQPVVSYSYEYFNPITKKSAKTLAEAMVQRSQFSKDPYSKYRSPQMAYVIGITMKVGYVIESDANDDDNDSASNDIINWVEYEYDLELNSKKEIIGGEWHIMAHPDFIWTPKKGARPSSALDSVLRSSNWMDGAPIPQIWADAARGSSRQGSILNLITEELVKKSSTRGLSYK